MRFVSCICFLCFGDRFAFRCLPSFLSWVVWVEIISNFLYNFLLHRKYSYCQWKIRLLEKMFIFLIFLIHLLWKGIKDGRTIFLSCFLLLTIDGETIFLLFLMHLYFISLFLVMNILNIMNFSSCLIWWQSEMSTP